MKLQLVVSLLIVGTTHRQFCFGKSTADLLSCRLWSLASNGEGLSSFLYRFGSGSSKDEYYSLNAHIVLLVDLPTRLSRA